MIDLASSITPGWTQGAAAGFTGAAAGWRAAKEIISTRLPDGSVSAPMRSSWIWKYSVAGGLVGAVVGFIWHTLVPGA